MEGPAPSLVGGRYRLDAVIGRGGMGEVHRATDLRLDREVAIKFFHAASADGADRLTREALLIARLGHRNLVAALDVSTDTSDGRAWLALELLRGPDVAALLQREGALPSETVRHLVHGVAEGLAHIHDRGIVHRDLKPANVILTADVGEREWHAKVADFGIARLLDDPRAIARGSVLGTAAYLSPEQTRGEPAGTASDVYALGLLALEALTGERAFPGGSVETAAARLRSGPVLPDWLRGTWRSLIETMTALEPANRPGAEAVARALVDPLPIAAPSGPSARTRLLDEPTAALTVPMSALAPRTLSEMPPRRAVGAPQLDAAVAQR